MMSEVCNNVSIEPHLQPLSGEALRFKRLQTLTPMLNLILLLKASGVEGLSALSLMFESSTLVHHRITLLSLPIATMRGRRGVSMSNVCTKLSMAILHH